MLVERNPLTCDRPVTCEYLYNSHQVLQEKMLMLFATMYWNSNNDL